MEETLTQPRTRQNHPYPISPELLIFLATSSQTDELEDVRCLSGQISQSGIRCSVNTADVAEERLDASLRFPVIDLPPLPWPSSGLRRVTLSHFTFLRPLSFSNLILPDPGPHNQVPPSSPKPLLSCSSLDIHQRKSGNRRENLSNPSWRDVRRKSLIRALGRMSTWHSGHARMKLSKHCRKWHLSSNRS